MTTLQTIPSWSISRHQTFESCKYRAKLQWLDKIPDTQPRPAADRGTMLHTEAEHYVNGTKDSTVHELRHFKDDLTSLRAHYAIGTVLCEEEWGFAPDWSIAAWRAAWLRLKADAVCFVTPRHACVIDYKSGKRFGNEVKHAIQLQLYAVCTLLRYPEVEEVTAELWYFDQNELASFVMKRKQLSKYLLIFDKIGKAFTTETAFKPNPNIFSCQYCPYHKAKQGDCIYGVELVKGGAIKVEVVNFVAPKRKPTAADDDMAAEAAAFLKGV